VKSLIKLDNDLKNILDDSSLTLEEKQIKLEKLSEKNQSFKLALDYQVPANLTTNINSIDNYFFDDKNLNSKDISYYLESTLYEYFKNQKAQKRSNKTKKNKEQVEGLKDILLVFKVLNNSFGLFLIYNLVVFLRSGFDNTKLRNQIENNDPVMLKTSRGPFDL
jgi:hypothetical protein